MENVDKVIAQILEGGNTEVTGGRRGRGKRSSKNHQSPVHFGKITISPNRVKGGSDEPVENISGGSIDGSVVGGSIVGGSVGDGIRGGKIRGGKIRAGSKSLSGGELVEAVQGGESEPIDGGKKKRKLSPGAKKNHERVMARYRKMLTMKKYAMTPNNIKLGMAMKGGEIDDV